MIDGCMHALFIRLPQWHERRKTTTRPRVVPQPKAFPPLLLDAIDIAIGTAALVWFCRFLVVVVHRQKHVVRVVFTLVQ